MSSPVFSILLCNYNYGNYIHDAIESVLSQSFSDFELIIVDDGSTDNSREVIDTFTDSRIKKIYKENGGQASAFNSGFEISNGNLIALLDSDDWWEADKLEVTYKYFNASKNNIALLQHLISDHENGKNTSYKNIIPSGDCWSEMQKTGNFNFFVPTSGLCFPREVCNKIFPIPNEFWFSADAFLMRAAIPFGRVLSIPEYLAYHRLHPNSFTSTILKDPSHLVFDLLIPNLNNFYARNNINYRIEIKRPEKGKTSLWQIKKKQLINFLRSLKALAINWNSQQ